MFDEQTMKAVLSEAVSISLLKASGGIEVSQAPTQSWNISLFSQGMLYEMCYKADIEWVVFTCGSSNGRGPRWAGWFLDHVRNTAEDTDMQVMVLEGGVKGWVKAGQQFTQLMDGYRPEYWEQLFAEEERSKEGKADTAASGTGGDPKAQTAVTTTST